MPLILEYEPRGVFYFRVVVPTRLRPFFGGRSEIKKSLSTRDPKHARLCAYSLSARVGIQFAKAEEALRVGYDTSKHNPLDPNTLAANANNTAFGVNVAGIKLEIDPNKPGDAEKAIATAKAMAKDPDIRALLERDQERERAENFARLAAISHAESLSIGDAIDQAAAKRNATPQPAAPPPAYWGNYQPIRFSAAMAECQTELNKKSKATQKAYNRTIGWFTRFLGKNDPFMREIDDALARRWKEEAIIPHFQEVADKKLADDLARGRIKVDPMVGLPQLGKSVPLTRKSPTSMRFSRHCKTGATCQARLLGVISIRLGCFTGRRSFIRCARWQTIV